MERSMLSRLVQFFVWASILFILAFMSENVISNSSSYVLYFLFMKLFGAQFLLARKIFINVQYWA